MPELTVLLRCSITTAGRRVLFDRRELRQRLQHLPRGSRPNHAHFPHPPGLQKGTLRQALRLLQCRTLPMPVVPEKAMFIRQTSIAYITMLHQRLLRASPVRPVLSHQPPVLAKDHVHGTLPTEKAASPCMAPTRSAGAPTSPDSLPLPPPGQVAPTFRDAEVTNGRGPGRMPGPSVVPAPPPLNQAIMLQLVKNSCDANR